MAGYDYEQFPLGHPDYACAYRNCGQDVRLHSDDEYEAHTLAHGTITLDNLDLFRKDDQTESNIEQLNKRLGTEPSDNDKFETIAANTCASGDCSKGILEHTLGEFAEHGNPSMSQARANRIFGRKK